MVNIELTLASLDTLLVTLHSATPSVLERAAMDLGTETRLEALNQALRCDEAYNLLVVLAADFSTESLHTLATWFPRRLNGGRVGVVSHSQDKGRAFASTLTVSLLPRPVRVFPTLQAQEALLWVQTGRQPVPLVAAERTALLLPIEQPPLLALDFLVKPSIERGASAS